MAQQNQTRECTVDQLQPELSALAGRYVLVNDRILCCFESKSEYPRDFLDFNVRFSLDGYVCTQQRVIRVYKYPGEFGNKYMVGTQSIDLSDIISVQEIQNQFGFNVHLSGQGDIHLPLRFYNFQAASKFATVVRDAIARAKANSSPTAPSNNVEARIRTLKQLRQDGLITEAQFQQRLQEIVNQL